MAERTCFNCASLVWPEPLKDFRDMLGWQGRIRLPVCVNHVDHQGLAREVHPGETCRNFCPRWRPAKRKKPPEPTDEGVRHIPLTKGAFAIVDADDFERLNRYKWHALHVRSQWYARRAPGGRVIMMHREIMQPPDGMVVDHIDGNGLNNRKCNLRICTQQQNMQNRRPLARSSAFKGVSFYTQTGKWHAEITLDGKKIYIGSYDDEIEAARAYDRKAIELFGEFAYLNFPAESRAVAAGSAESGAHIR